jgi:hypothetical protein
LDIELLKNGLYALEAYVLREVERLVAGTGTACPVTLCNKIELCIKLNNELGLIVGSITVQEYLDRSGYDSQFVKTYLDMTINHSEETCPNERFWHSKQ